MFDKIANILGNTKARTILLFFATIVIFTTAIILFTSGQDQATKQIEKSMTNKAPDIKSIPGEITSKTYQKIQESQNIERMNKAKKTGTSSISTIVGGKDLVQEVDSSRVSKDLFELNQQENDVIPKEDCKCNNDDELNKLMLQIDSDNAFEMLNANPELAKFILKNDPKLYKQLLNANDETALLLLQDNPNYTSVLAREDPELFNKLLSKSPKIAEVLLANEPEYSKILAENNPELFKKLFTSSPKLAKILLKNAPKASIKLLKDDPELLAQYAKDESFMGLLAEVEPNFAAEVAYNHLHNLKDEDLKKLFINEPEKIINAIEKNNKLSAKFAGSPSLLSSLNNYISSIFADDNLDQKAFIDKFPKLTKLMKVKLDPINENKPELEYIVPGLSKQDIIEYELLGANETLNEEMVAKIEQDQALQKYMLQKLKTVKRLKEIEAKRKKEEDDRLSDYYQQEREKYLDSLNKEKKEQIKNYLSKMKTVSNKYTNQWDQIYDIEQVDSSKQPENNSSSDSVAANELGDGENINKLGYKAGDIVYAVIDTEVNSDEPSPILATIVSGKHKNAKIIGSFQKPSEEAEKLVIKFNSMSIPNEPNSRNISAVAIDASTSRTALSSDVDHHYLKRYGSIIAAAFLEGYGKSATQVATTTQPSGEVTTTSNPVAVIDPKEPLMQGLGKVGTTLGKQAEKNFSTPITIKIKSGTSIGLLFTNDV